MADTGYTTCDRCGDSLTAEALAQGWPIALDDGHVCPDCYGPEAFCREGHVLPAETEHSDCPTCSAPCAPAPGYQPDPEAWYDAYGYHLTPEDPDLPDVPLQQVPYDMAIDADAAAAALRAEEPRLAEAEAETLADRAAAVRRAADEICSVLERARDARTIGDRLRHLAEAAREEQQYGDIPETRRARRELREEV